MTHLGRLAALILLVLAMLAETGAPALAAVPRDAFGSPICTDMGVVQPGGKQSPAPMGHVHDCCAAACAAASLTFALPTEAGPAFALSEAVIARGPIRARTLAPRGPPVRFAEARGPPVLS